MADIIQLLPDNIANQIAAGEVIQRPASAVKELLENAVDAGATEIKLIVTDAGKSLIQVIDNGKGMSETDARMAFERHATSKIKVIDDLFHIKTMGFRGEALASIAAVAQVELKTRRADDELGTFIEIENSKVVKQEPCALAVGTSISMKNLFFNVPARRNFLKTNASELRHIIDEFIRVAMSFPHIFFSLSSNGQNVFHLEKGNIKQRVTQILGNSYNAKLVSVKENTDYMNIYGFVGKPDTAKKTRGDQYFFVNNRFIRSNYLNHAISSSFENLLAKDSFPSYVLFIDLDPSQIDINVHPTKQEIKFEDEKIVYAFIQSAVKHALAQFSIAPSLDFSLNAEIQQLDAVNKPFSSDQQRSVSSSNLFQSFTEKHQAHKIEPNEKSELKHWKEFFGSREEKPTQTNIELGSNVLPEINNTTASPFDHNEYSCLQINNAYIVSTFRSGFILVHQQLAHERVLYERYSKMVHHKQVVVQKILFPITLELAVADAILLEDLLPEIVQLGFEIEHFGNNTFIIQGSPADIKQGNEKHSIELLLEQFKHFSSEMKFSKREKLIRCMARQQSIKTGQSLGEEEMKTLIVDLFECNTPNVSPAGNPTYIEYKKDYIERMFER